MSKAGTLKERVAFEKKLSVSDGGGGTQDTWTHQFYSAAEYVHLRGGEAVMAARLEGKHMQVIKVRASINSKLVDTDWRIKDTRTDEYFNIRDREPDIDRAYIHFTCERGVAT